MKAEQAEIQSILYSSFFFLPLLLLVIINAMRGRSNRTTQITAVR